MTKEALKLALEALDGGHLDRAYGYIQEALAQPDYRAVKTYHEGKPVYVSQLEQEPVAWVCNECGAHEFTSAVSEEDLKDLACASCGCDEFHKEALALPEQEQSGFFSREAMRAHSDCPDYTTPPKRQPLTDDEINKCDMCGYVGKDKDSIGQCPKCRWDELRPLVEKARQKPLTDDQIYDMYNEPRSDAEMLEFARAIEAALGIKE